MTTYTVVQSRFHGGREISAHSTLRAALRAARRAAGHCWSRNRGWAGLQRAACCCGGPRIIPSDGGNVVRYSDDCSSGVIHYAADGSVTAQV
ncbi:hypothetical protein UFOVP141_27 [uncultured Caudovirales phage]|uniref:Uncharacterized protein n=1 Tax=uncultured Caudovirales phage TaxID=2100421 RepID=A0A6J7VT47_9CAUD|nr:hypothetical protein UFOVP141_27 [uncultured Caudovirales phage]